MSIAVLGVNHRTAPLEVRERFAHAAHEVPPALERVLRAGAGGGVLLSTCNRTEFYLAQRRGPGIRVRAARPRRRAPPLPRFRGPRLDDPGGVPDPGSGAGGVAGLARQ